MGINYLVPRHDGNDRVTLPPVCIVAVRSLVLTESDSADSCGMPSTARIQEPEDRFDSMLVRQTLKICPGRVMLTTIGDDVIFGFTDTTAAIISGPTAAISRMPAE